MSRHLRFWKRLYVATAVAYVALGFAFAGRGARPARAHRPLVYHTPGHQGADGLRATRRCEAYYNYLQLRHLQQQTQTYGVNNVDLVIIYGILGGVLLIFSCLIWVWHMRQKRKLPGLYPVEVYNGYIAERGAPVDIYVWSNYAVMLAFMGFYIWWNLIFGQWY